MRIHQHHIVLHPWNGPFIAALDARESRFHRIEPKFRIDRTDRNIFGQQAIIGRSILLRTKLSTSSRQSERGANALNRFVSRVEMLERYLEVLG